MIGNVTCSVESLNVQNDGSTEFSLQNIRIKITNEQIKDDKVPLLDKQKVRSVDIGRDQFLVRLYRFPIDSKNCFENVHSFG